MKRAKLALVAIVVLASVSGVVAFKAKRTSITAYTGTAANSCPNLTTILTSAGVSNAFYTLDPTQTTNCQAVRIVAAE